MSPTDYLEISRRFARELEDRQGVFSVGLGKESGEIVLVVALAVRRDDAGSRSEEDPAEVDLPAEFGGLRVVVKVLGEAQLFTAEEVTMSNGNELSDAGAIQALRIVARRWLDSDGAKAFAIVQAATMGKALGEIDIDPQIARRALDSLSGSILPAVAGWTEEAIAEVLEDETKGQAHLLDPVTVAIVGATVIGAILAARVRKIGAAEFYEGVPEELATVMKAGASFLGEGPDPGGGGLGGGS